MTRNIDYDKKDLIDTINLVKSASWWTRTFRRKDFKISLRALLLYDRQASQLIEHGVTTDPELRSAVREADALLIRYSRFLKK